MVDNKEKEIEGMKVNVTQFPARFGFKMQAKLLRIFGPVIGTVLSGNDISKGVMNSDVSMGNLSEAIKRLFEVLDEDKSLALVLDLLQQTRIDGQEVNEGTFDTLFPGKYLALYKILGFVLEVNYGSFFGEGGIGRKVVGLVQTK